MKINFLKEDQLISELEKLFKNSLPGVEAQLRLAPRYDISDQWVKNKAEAATRAAVLLLLFLKNNAIYFILTRRAENVMSHGGQISLPGGVQHPGESAEQTALRETAEELGLDLNECRIIGQLTPLHIPTSNFLVSTVVAFLPAQPHYEPEPAEVAEVIEVPIEVVLNSAYLKQETRILNNQELIIPFYEYQGYRIWGATAMILAEFGALLGA